MRNISEIKDYLKNSLIPSLRTTRFALQVMTFVFLVIAVIAIGSYHSWSLSISICVLIACFVLSALGIISEKTKLVMVSLAMISPVCLLFFSGNGRAEAAREVTTVIPQSAKQNSRVSESTPLSAVSPSGVPSSEEGDIKITLPKGKDDVETNGTTASEIPVPDAPARPNANASVALAKEVPVSTERPCRTITDPGLVHFESGDFFVTLFQCQRKGNQIHFSGTIQYHGIEPSTAAFGTFGISGSPLGTSYPVIDSKFHDSRDFGKSYSEQDMDPGVTLGFSFDVGPVQDSPITVSLTMPTILGQASMHIVFSNLLIN